VSNLEQQGLIAVVVNGQERRVPAGLTVLELLNHLGVDPARVAVELDREICRKPSWTSTAVRAGAQLEIVEFVGGG
jgi:thiamine biosynthesis protein ThiS